MTLLWIIILLMIFQPTYQKKYLCNPNLECGCSIKPAAVARIVNGEDANEGTWGSVVSLSIKNGNDLCGGSILSSSWIITAAHCALNVKPSEVVVYAGSNILWSGTQNRTVSQIIVHPNFRLGTYVNDIALLKLTIPLNMDDPAVNAICFPSISSEQLTTGEWPAPKTSVIAVGWGKLMENGPFPKNLQQVTLQTIDYQASTCRQLITNKQVQFCAGVDDSTKDTCQGDSGGPLMMFTSTKQWILVGLTSSGYGCAEKGYSGVYTRVAAFEQWINSNTNGGYSKVKDFQPLTNSIIKSSANMISQWCYATFLCAIVSLFFIFS